MWFSAVVSAQAQVCFCHLHICCGLELAIDSWARLQNGVEPDNQPFWAPKRSDIIWTASGWSLRGASNPTHLNANYISYRGKVSCLLFRDSCSSKENKICSFRVGTIEYLSDGSLRWFLRVLHIFFHGLSTQKRLLHCRYPKRFLDLLGRLVVWLGYGTQWFLHGCCGLWCQQIAWHGRFNIVGCGSISYPPKKG